MCWYANYDKPVEGPEAIDICVALHADAGVRHLVWNLGRSVVDYWSDLPHVTRMCELGDQVGGMSWAFVREVMDRVCPLRRAMEQSARSGLTLWGRLGMNRHYGSEACAGVTSRLALESPHLRERSKTGEPVPGRLCYAFDEVRQERIDILLEAQRLGVHGLVLDFCRQVPMLQYHEALVDAFAETTGTDPRLIDSAGPEPYADWFQYRADVLTGFMANLRVAVRDQERALGRPCPIVARVPDSGRWLMLAYGLDTERWCGEDLVDGLVLSPFPITREDLALHTGEHVSAAHDRGKWCVGGIGSKGLIVNGVAENTGHYAAAPVHALAAGQLEAGVDGLSLYQSESLLRMEYLRGLWPVLGGPAEEIPDAPGSVSPGVEPAIGMDWHADMGGRHGLRVSEVGAGAL